MSDESKRAAMYLDIKKALPWALPQELLDALRKMNAYREAVGGDLAMRPVNLDCGDFVARIGVSVGTKEGMLSGHADE